MLSLIYNKNLHSICSIVHIGGLYSICHFCRAVEMATADHTLQPGTFDLQAPIYDPQKLICVGLNYVDHCTEQNVPVPKEPVIFSKFPSTITEPNGVILLSEETNVRPLHYQSVLV